MEFYPFFFLSNSKYLKDYPNKHWLRELSGNNYYRYLCAFQSWTHMWDAIRFCLNKYNENAPQKIDSYLELAILQVRTDPVAQFLSQTGRTLFKGMKFDDLYRLQIRIKTFTKHGYKSCNPQRLEDRILIMALSDNHGWEYIISGKKKSEKEMLLELVNIIIEKDPDVIEGHNLLEFDFAYIIARCELHGIEFSVGRDNSAPKPSDARLSYMERSTDYSLFEIAGRHLIDTLVLVETYENTHNELESYNLDYLAKHFDFSKSKTPQIPSEKVNWFWENQPDELIKSSFNEVNYIRELSNILSPFHFIMTQMIPFNYGNVYKLSSRAKIESLMLREYIHQKRSIPQSDSGSTSQLNETKIFYSGVLSPILNLDVESLFPSIMVKEKVSPRHDKLGIFALLLEELSKNISVSDIVSLSQASVLQDSIKSFMSTFFDYLSDNRALFNDFILAEKISTAGSLILKNVVERITQLNGKVVTMDTKDILFIPPPTIRNKSGEDKFIESLSETNHNRTNLLIKNRYKRMWSYKKNNYALLCYDDKLIIRGASIFPKNTEGFGREFITRCISSLLQEDYNTIHNLYAEFHEKIIRHKLNPSEFMRTEILRESSGVYLNAVKNKRRNPSASYEVAINSGIAWKPGDKISYYISGDDPTAKDFKTYKLISEWDKNFPDENVVYYLKRLDEFAKKFMDLFTEKDYHSLFSTDDLIIFTPDEIKTLSYIIQSESKKTDDEEEPIRVNPNIWLNEDELF